MAGETFLTRIKVWLDGAGKASSDAKKVSKQEQHTLQLKVF